MGQRIRGAIRGAERPAEEAADPLAQLQHETRLQRQRLLRREPHHPQLPDLGAVGRRFAAGRVAVPPAQPTAVACPDRPGLILYKDTAKRPRHDPAPAPATGSWHRQQSAQSLCRDPQRGRARWLVRRGDAADPHHQRPSRNGQDRHQP